MARLLFSADWHIKLGQKHVPALWQINRFHMLVDKLNKRFEASECDVHVIGGDIFDRFDPTPEEIELYFDLISKLNHKTLIYTGNHEMKSKTKSVLDNLAEETTRCNPLVEVVIGVYRSQDFDIIDYKELHKKSWAEQQSRICLTHVRGEIPPHVTPEIDLAKFDTYDLVLAGDLHSYQNTQTTDNGTTILYPGSPLTTTFHRERTRKTNGCIVINTETLNYVWHDLKELPQLIRKTIQVGEPMIKDEYDRVIYEVEGDISELKSIQDSDLLDKKVNKNVGKPAALDLTNKSGTDEELAIYLTEVEALPKDTVNRLVGKYKQVVPNAD
ncbi:putative recombination endonuclease subunit D12 [Vibrio phage Pontus]|uniref:Putative recombination endonuclease subunit D12 n=1 Tax=Vibrio phage Pontus TaxID=2590874 RepID=A0A4Y6EJ63_9CAUD|nr:putative recombination endonuclease subunit D12 [Vibrio phage Pontus]QDF14692.1 putative recombination endonuclease subunit D12 [Vibrio phage Pontus]